MLLAKKCYRPTIISYEFTVTTSDPNDDKAPLKREIRNAERDLWETQGPRHEDPQINRLKLRTSSEVRTFYSTTLLNDVCRILI